MKLQSHNADRDTWWIGKNVRPLWLIVAAVVLGAAAAAVFFPS